MTLYDKNGKTTENEKDAWAKEGKSHYIKCAYGHIVNPEEMGLSDLRWFRVNQETFQYYLQFLKTKKMYFLTQAQRKSI